MAPSPFSGKDKKAKLAFYAILQLPTDDEFKDDNEWSDDDKPFRAPPGAVQRGGGDEDDAKTHADLYDYGIESLSTVLSFFSSFKVSLLKYSQLFPCILITNILSYS